MGMESHEYPSQVVHSSIALLQERFRELQRVKEMREEKELLRLLSEPNNNNTSYINKQFNLMKSLTPDQYYYEPTKLIFQPNLVPHHQTTPLPKPQVSLSLWPTFQTSFHEEQYYYVNTNEMSPDLLMKSSSWPIIVNSPSFKSSMNDSVDHEPDVDTSLHL
ncbi:hypothetical protein F8388_021389 [Cannabis sativa]|uniref:Uncharacterized protein n=1 Tax=Cannabis sativa TaxID=3483 RepID=A0A7J6FDL2_CANSA|nr:hypothetical protein F8388_021389 [Cannabis sativa]